MVYIGNIIVLIIILAITIIIGSFVFSMLLETTSSSNMILSQNDSSTMLDFESNVSSIIAIVIVFGILILVLSIIMNAFGKGMNVLEENDDSYNKCKDGESELSQLLGTKTISKEEIVNNLKKEKMRPLFKDNKKFESNSKFD